MKDMKKVSAAYLKTLQRYSLSISRLDQSVGPKNGVPYVYKPKISDVHYWYSDENGAALLCKIGYYPNHRITKDKTKITCIYCQSIILLENNETQGVTIH